MGGGWRREGFPPAAHAGERRLPARTPRGRRCSAFALPARSPAFSFPMSRFVGALITPRYRDDPLRTSRRRVWFTVLLHLSRDQFIRTFINSVVRNEKTSRVRSTCARRWDRRRSVGQSVRGNYGRVGNDHIYTSTRTNGNGIMRLSELRGLGSPRNIAEYDYKRVQGVYRKLQGEITLGIRLGGHSSC